MLGTIESSVALEHAEQAGIILHTFSPFAAATLGHIDKCVLCPARPTDANMSTITSLKKLHLGTPQLSQAPQERH